MPIPLAAGLVTPPLAALTPRRNQLAEELFACLAGIKRRLMAGVPAELRQGFGTLTWHQVEALHQLSAARGELPGATMNELAKMQQCALSSATALVDRLIRQGLAERRADPDDRRVIRIVPTAVGEEMLLRSQEARRRLTIESLSPLTDDELESLVGLMRKVVPAQAGEADVQSEVAHD